MLNETYIEAKKFWHYLYSIVEKQNNTLDVICNKTHNKKDAKQFFNKRFSNKNVKNSSLINIDKVYDSVSIIQKLRTSVKLANDLSGSRF